MHLQIQSEADRWGAIEMPILIHALPLFPLFSYDIPSPGPDRHDVGDSSPTVPKRQALFTVSHSNPTPTLNPVRSCPRGWGRVKGLGIESKCFGEGAHMPIQHERITVKHRFCEWAACFQKTCVVGSQHLC